MSSAKAAINFVRQAAAIGVVIGVVDYFWSRKKTMDGMKMSKHEIKEESRSQDLPPEVRGRIRQRQRQFSRNRMMAAMKSADVVIVNPVHIAVALQYDPEKGAPRVLAKGAGFVAEKIKEKAEELKLPLVQDIPLARAIHKSCDIDDEIPAAVVPGSRSRSCLRLLVEGPRYERWLPQDARYAGPRRSRHNP